MSNVSNAVPRLGVLSCLKGRDDETGLYVAHCLDFDLVESGPTPERAWENLKLVIKHHIEYCYTSDPKGLTISAEAHYWKQFASLMGTSAASDRVIESISIDLKPPLPAADVPVWIHGVTTWQNLNCEHLAYGR